MRRAQVGECKAENCTATVRGGKQFCMSHWHLVPDKHRKTLSRHPRETGVDAWREALEQSIEAIRTYEEAHLTT